MTHITVAALRIQRKIHNNTKLSFKWDLLMLFVTISLFFKYARQKMAKWRSLCKIKHNLNKLAWHWYKCGSILLEAGVWVSCLRMYVLPWRTNSAQTVAVTYTTASTCKVNINKHKWTSECPDEKCFSVFKFFVLFLLWSETCHSVDFIITPSALTELKYYCGKHKANLWFLVPRQALGHVIFSCFLWLWAASLIL